MWRVLVFPFTLIYGIIVLLRNKFFDWGILRSKKFDIPVISVGNLSVGGSGKSPHVEYLIRLLKKEYNIATLSRGYRRKTKGFRIVKQQATAREVGDEPCQFKHKFREITVAVDEKRRRGIEKIKQLDPYVEVILLDDAFQHRYVKPGLSILVTDFHNPYPEDFLMPSGRLREQAWGAKRADIIIVSKTPNVLSPITKRRFYHEINPLPHQLLLFTYVKYGMLRKVFESNSEDKIPQSFNSILMVTGIANPYPLEEHLREKCYDLEKFSYPDHHKFSKSDLKKIKKAYDNIFSPKKAIITTEKDAARLRSTIGIELLKDLPLYLIPVEVAFHKGQKQKFDRKVLNYVRENQGNQ
ncbi:MAG: tetraacyldisaccharide 4'-kinase [Bacteroidales bacterium]|nr:tetraacyldisaccharide 4'-kinase [Bacteroidales bacterium]MCF8333158.1 tetraacyldisaccharide 4'-kinase [Bacteroidales bacterium]